MTAARTFLQAERISKSFGPKKVLSGLNFYALEHETVALLGENGSGKTTFINILATLLSPDQGKVSYFGQPLNGNESGIRRRLGIVSHQLLLYSDLSAEENLRFYARLYALPEPEQRVEQILDLVGLKKQRSQVVRTFSRGMQQRLAIGRALLHDPSILFLDEPFTGLDQNMTERMQNLLKQIMGQEKTVIMTSHSFKEVSLLASRALFLQGGYFVDTVALAGMNEHQLAERYQAVIHPGG
jgi:heme exporter protein A